MTLSCDLWPYHVTSSVSSHEGSHSAPTWTDTSMHGWTYRIRIIMYPHEHSFRRDKYAGDISFFFQNALVAILKGKPVPELTYSTLRKNKFSWEKGTKIIKIRQEIGKIWHFPVLYEYSTEQISDYIHWLKLQNSHILVSKAINLIFYLPKIKEEMFIVTYFVIGYCLKIILELQKRKFSKSYINMYMEKMGRDDITSSLNWIFIS